MANKSKSAPACELINTYYQVCNHVTISLHHATRIVPTRSTSKSSEPSSYTPSSNQTITTCPQAIHNLSLPPPLDQQQKSETTLCPSVVERTVINSGYGCPECEPEYHRSTDYVSTQKGHRDKIAVNDEDRRKKRFKWCMLAITEWEARKKAAVGERPSDEQSWSILKEQKVVNQSLFYLINPSSTC
ncbi:hypothetical protein SBOR_1647 [Sclerotinia borealis F-4128]|uniref:Uncharacterized protein n=1 Tax=Sclerotinia borealis (strain F-4128) TaxID=1432307 RepID=W9CQ61_SCLBF|nr:hypothetical protein SBOR_1647 [Sclerotinia borealis F-4128]